MTVRVFGQPLRHRADGRASMLMRTRCGIRFAWDRDGYLRAQRITGSPEPASRCAECFG